ncbi:hypothetical protein BJ991_000002 [Microbacterium immunditiarum]|uniref:Uncharacterized protein n=1 Tax=Microbacterium immunditiarum TaxID=337480 RepID=A0A7Y9GK85_9MICO|nr:hypothetical protein [Microbacterium immunditiarum]
MTYSLFRSVTSLMGSLAGARFATVQPVYGSKVNDTLKLTVGYVS